MYYFAYGSNMCTARLARRVPSVRPVGAATLAGHTLAWHLRGNDDSGKCNVVASRSDTDVVHGVVFELDADRLEALHAAEGPAYAFLELPVTLANSGEDETVSAAIYRGHAEWLDDTLVPYDWYRDFVVTGARAHGLPDDWIAWLANASVNADPDIGRAADNRRILTEVPTNVRA